MVNTCKNCKHFKRMKKTKGYEHENNILLGTCQVSKYIETFDSISSVSEIDFGKDFKNKAYAESEWGDCVQMLVGEDFGCIHFKEKKN